jgi:integrase
MARKAGQLISCGQRTWLVRVSLGRDPETGTRKYHNRTVHGSFREAQTYLNAKLQERDIGRLPRAAAIRLDDYLDQWLATSAKPRLRPKSYVDYEGLLPLHIRPGLGAKPIGVRRIGPAGPDLVLDIRLVRSPPSLSFVLWS